MENTKTVHILNSKGVIVNTIVVNRLEDYPGSVDASLGGSIGDTITSGVLVPTPVEVPAPAVPESVTRRQARQALLIKGHLHKVEAAIASIDDGTEQGGVTAKLALIEWEDSLNFERNRPLVIQIGLALGLGKEGLDELFIYASTL